MVAAVIGATVVGGYLSSENSADAATQAAQIQGDASAASVAERRRQFDVAQGLLKPWIDSGSQALSGQKDLIGVNGADPQQAAIDALKNGPEFTSLQKTGQNAILAAGSATGGLRGGNINGALAQYDQSLLSSLIDKQYGRLTGVANAGQNAAAGTANIAVNTGSGIAGDLGEGGAAAAGGILGQARAQNGFINSAVNAAGVYAGTQPYVAPAAYTGGFGGGPLFA